MSPLDVVLISAPSPLATALPFGDVHLVFLGSAIEAWTDARVRLVDLRLERMLGRGALEAVLDGATDVVGISCYSSLEVPRVQILAEEIRRRRPDAILVVGGYHPSARPGDFTGDGAPFDHVVIGEGELPLARVVGARAAGGPAPPAVLGPEPVPDLDQLPPMNWSLLDRYLGIARTHFRQVAFSFSRGCPYSCSFCMEPVMGAPGWRAWSPARAEAELRRLHAWLDLTGWKLFVCDPVFGLDRSWRGEMLDRMIQLDLPLAKTWALSRADLLDSDDLERFHRAGFGLGFGLESGDPAMLRIIQKRGEVYLELFDRLAAAAGRVGLPWAANVIVGHPGETEESLRRSAERVRTLFTRPRRSTGLLSIDPYSFYPGTGVDRDLETYQQEHGTVVHRRRWWDDPDPEFTSTWVDPSRWLDYRARERMTAERFGPILGEAHDRFAYEGPSRDYFTALYREQAAYWAPRRRLRTIAALDRWRSLVGSQTAVARGDDEVAILNSEVRGRTVEEIDRRFGPLSRRLREAMIQVPSEAFVPRRYLDRAGLDEVLPLVPDGSATRSALHAYALAFSLLDLSEGDRLLELGGGAGYGTALAAAVVGPRGAVRSVEIEPALVQRARQNLHGVGNVEVRGADASLGDSLAAGYKKVIFWFAIPGLPDQVSALPEGGRLVAPVTTATGDQVLTRAVRCGSQVTVSQHGNVSYLPRKSSADPLAGAAQARPAARGGRQDRGGDIRTSAWIDLVFHALACIPLDPGDAAGLRDARYPIWIGRHRPASDRRDLLLESAAPSLAGLWNRRPRAGALALLVVLHGDSRAFLAGADVAFSELDWPTRVDAALAAGISKACGRELIECFRAGLRAAIRGGYLEVRDRVLAPLYRRRIPVVRDHLEILASRIGGLDGGHVHCSHPLRRFGRVIPHAGGPWVAVGLPDTELDVPDWAPGFQACHEVLVARAAGLAGSDAESAATLPGAPGYENHLRTEMLAIAVGARLLSAEPSYTRWLASCLPSSCASLARSLPWPLADVPRTPGVPALADWLAQGGALPEVMRPGLSTLAGCVGPGSGRAPA